jgi:hypothetical protein
VALRRIVYHRRPVALRANPVAICLLGDHRSSHDITLRVNTDLLHGPIDLDAFMNLDGASLALSSRFERGVRFADPVRGSMGVSVGTKIFF